MDQDKMLSKNICANSKPTWIGHLFGLRKSDGQIKRTNFLLMQFSHSPLCLIHTFNSKEGKSPKMN